MTPSRILAVQHVEIESPSGIEASLRWFYSDLGQLEEIELDPAGERILSFRSGPLLLRVRMRQNPVIDRVRRRLTLVVPSLPEAIELLEERACWYMPLSGFTFTDRRIATYDPAGNRVELKQEWPYAPL